MPADDFTSGQIEIIPGLLIGDDDALENAKLRQIAQPTGRVKAGAIGPRELDIAKIHDGLFQSDDYAAGMFTDGEITIGSTAFRSAGANFTSADIGRRLVVADIPAGTTISSVIDAQNVVLSAPAAIKITDGIITGGTALASASAVFTSADNGRTIIGDGIASGTALTYVDATHATLSQESANAINVKFQINGRTANEQKFTIVGRGAGWKLTVDEDGAGSLELYTGIFSGVLAIGAFHVAGDGTLSIGTGDMMMRAFPSGTFTWGTGAATIGIRADGKIWAGAEGYDAAVTRIKETGDVEIQDLASSDHNIAIGAINPTVVAPVLSPQGGAIANPTNVDAASDTHHARIYYRQFAKDGVTNTDSSFVSASGNFTARDVGKDIFGTGIPAGAFIKSVTNATTLVLSANTTATATSVEWYMEVNKRDTLYVAGSPIVLTGTIKIAAVAFTCGEYSALTAQLFSIDPTTVPNPTFSPPPGSYGGGLVVNLACTLAGSKIRYTLDGTTPTTSTGTLIDSESGNVTMPAGTTTIKAIAYKAGITNPSAVVSGAFTVSSGSSGGKVATPTFTPDGFTSSAHGAQTVTIATATTGSIAIRYTKNGTAPTRTNGTLISGSSGSASVAASLATILKAIAYKTDSSLLDSDVKTATYDFTSTGTGGGGFGGGGGCFSRNTMVKTKRGNLSIALIIAGQDELLTAAGNWLPVEKLMIHDGEWDMIDMGGGELATLEHPILTKEGTWSPAAVVFSGNPTHRFKGKVYHVRVQSDEPKDKQQNAKTERSFTLANGRIAHNFDSK